MAEGAEWLAQVNEAAIEPELPIIDPHHHFWDRRNSRYLAEDLFADVDGHNVRQTVFVECSWAYRKEGPPELAPVGETEYVERVAEQYANAPCRPAAGIVGTADLLLGDAVVPVLEAQMAASPKRFRGIRHRAAWAEPGVLPNQAPDQRPHLLLDPAFRKGYGHLKRFSMTFEGWVYHPQLPEVADLARAFPDTTIILNHLGAPLGVGPYAGHREEVRQVWQKNMAEVARCPNVVLKVGGIQMPVNGFGWHERERPPTSDELVAVNGPWYRYAIGQFGPERCMFESNFPVDKASCSYTVLWNQFKKLTQDFSPSQRAAMFHDNALRVYRLERH